MQGFDGLTPNVLECKGFDTSARTGGAPPDPSIPQDERDNRNAGVFGVRAQIPLDFVSPFGCYASLGREIVI